MLRKLSLAALAALPLLHGCGNSSSTSSSGVRLVNATADYPTLDLYLGTTAVSTGATSTPPAAGSYGNVDSGTQTLSLRPAGSATTVASGAYSISGDTRYTVVAYIDPSSQLKGALLTDTEAAPTSGTAKFRIFNTISYTPSGSTTASDLLDAYVTTLPCSSLATSATSATSAGVKALGAYTEVTAPAAGTSYRVCVTGAGDRSDLRLDLPAVTLKDQQITTLVLTATPGGVLVNGVQVDQQGDVTARANASARVRVVADAASRGTVSATVNSVVLATNLASPVIGSYVLVPAGTLASSVQVNGTTVSATGAGGTGSPTAAPGADLTLLVTGSPAASTAAATFIADNNRPSTSSASPVKLRVVNGVNGLAGGVTLLDNFAAVASNVAFGTASTPANVAATTGTVIEVTSPSTVTVNGTPTNSVFRLAGDNAPTLVAGRVYSVFVLGDAANNPVGVLRQDR